LDLFKLIVGKGIYSSGTNTCTNTLPVWHFFRSGKVAWQTGNLNSSHSSFFSELIWIP